MESSMLPIALNTGSTYYNIFSHIRTPSEVSTFFAISALARAVLRTAPTALSILPLCESRNGVVRLMLLKKVIR
ncbi:hypothetical protein RSOLAG1IB_03102 [Rhizoctonia solani AG-1 IB]|uniref:Uncharacterized protein n=1 Tax=Thanatephorus cucumeris (strain AG1-IB / isolate 7/3/14) TaxID=1108050 RepID=A0A0B7FK32_THACB|nr:hypothetical protein RSOLAG1IB_03102 [Rhizoctonia solani AG-1 IB]